MRDLADTLLSWYDRNARVMPWRVSPADRKEGVRPDPYFIWMSEVMLQQTTVAAVKDYFRKFTAIWPTVGDLAAADDADVMAAWAGLGYYARARNLLKCARAVVADHGGQFPDTYDALIKLPGIGPYTAAAVSSIAFDRPETVLDGNVERVMARMYDAHTPLPEAKPKLMTLAEALTPNERPGDYAQAVMDLGATICTPKSPACGICPWRELCQARIAGTAADLPKKTPKKKTPIRHGFVYVTRDINGAWLLETRPEKGLLGGMLGFPTSDWSDDPQHHFPIDAQWEETGLEARHTFTHFHLRLAILTAQVPADVPPQRGQFVPHTRFVPAALPTAMRKVYDLIATLRHD
ncbi:A/G-specific adenine glycosylase [Yoonia sp. 208BN28-4]|uniref:A/G-specific adenine glycosylase n=1 Tax=Yoonia sp. 208BN28-4 TaxID=3126505 RepID=UPI0030AB3772